MKTRTDANGAVTTYDYDSLQRLVKVTAPDLGETVYGYDLGGARNYTKDAGGAEAWYTFDYKGRVKTVTDSLGHVTTYAYGGSGCPTCGGGGDNLVSVTDPLGHVVRYEYDTLGRRTKETDALGKSTTYTYDDNGGVSTRTDALNRVTGYGYDELSRQTGVVDAAGGTVNTGYDADGRVASVTDPLNHTTSYQYDLAGRRTRTVSPDTGTTVYTYNVDGSLHTKTDAKNVTATYVYDTAGRVTGITFPDSADNVTYEYGSSSADAGDRGRLVRMTDATGATVYHYDVMGRVISEVETVLGVAYTTSYEYYVAGGLKAVVYPDGKRIGYTYDVLRRPTGVSVDGVTRAGWFVYDDASRQTSMTLNNGAVEGWEYNAANRVTAITVPGVMGLGYTYDDVGNITAITNTLNAASNKTYSYDAVDRLKGAEGPWGRMSWTYDANGNRLKQSNLTGLTYNVGTPAPGTINPAIK